MTWTLLLGLVAALGLALLGALGRRNDLRRMRRSIAARDEAQRQGSAEAQLQHPVIDLSRCMGCATCVAVCPEDGVLELVHGQAVVVNGARCVGIAACERECPVDAITVTIAAAETRNDIPAITGSLEAVGTQGLFLAGEVTARSLVKTATDHGAAVAREVADRRRAAGTADDPAEVPAEVPSEIPGDHAGDHAGDHPGVLDLCIVGAGPAGLACALAAKERGLRAVCLEQEPVIGGTVARYPRRKLVLTEPIDLPLHGRLTKRTYSKEELIELWQLVAREHALPIRTGETLTGVERDAAGHFVVTTRDGRFRARYVCLALGRRGVPRRLGVPGEDRPNVQYELTDARSYRGRRSLVVGGGDSAAEAAIALAEQPGNEVTIAYRKASFFRLKTANRQHLDACIAGGRVRVLFRTRVLAIRPGAVELETEAGGKDTGSGNTAGGDTAGGDTGGGDTAGGDSGDLLRDDGDGGGRATATGPATLPNDDVFVMAGGMPMTDLLERSGVSFDPKLREPTDPIGEQGTGLVRALAWALGFAVVALLWAAWHADYYALHELERSAHPDHAMLRPGLGLGLWFGITATALIVVNLLYLARKSVRIPFRFGSLKAWMTSHVGTGILAFLCALLHSAMAPGDSPGGHALWALGILLVTGAIGRYFYAWLPRAANGRELELSEVRKQLAELHDGWDDKHREFSARVRRDVERLVARRQWQGSFFGRLAALAGMHFDLRRALRGLALHGRSEGIDEAQIRETFRLARAAHRTAVIAAHFEDLRALLNSWRWLHRWAATLLVLLVVVHIVHAMIYGAFAQGGGG